jgi:hypothetical protein
MAVWSMLIEPLTPIKTRVPLHGADDPMFQVEVAAFQQENWKADSTLIRSRSQIPAGKHNSKEPLYKRSR